MNQNTGSAFEAELAHRVRRYKDALELVLRQRPASERTKPITDEEHQLAVQIAENVNAYEAGLRERHVPEKAVTLDTGAPAQEATPAGPASRPRAGHRRPRRKGGRAARQESPARAAHREAQGEPPPEPEKRKRGPGRPAARQESKAPAAS